MSGIQPFGDNHKMSQSTNTLLIDNHNRLNTSMRKIIRGLRKLSNHLYSSSLSELFAQLEEATTSSHLTRTVNGISNLLWKLPIKEQGMIRKHLVETLNDHVLHATDAALRLEAASWLRLLVQAGMIKQPESIFVTLVTATVRFPAEQNDAAALYGQKALLESIFECFWPFRFPYPAYSWEVFPANQVFYPLAPLINRADYEMQDLLMGIFAELPALDDAEILAYLLPVALQWSSHTDAERRRRVANILARVHQASTQDALQRLLTDTDPAVRESAKSAVGYARSA
jgi:hypothetical protein